MLNTSFPRFNEGFHKYPYQSCKAARNNMDTASQKNSRHSFSVQRNVFRGYSDISSPQSCFPQQFHRLFNAFLTDHHSIPVHEKRMHCPDTNTQATNKHVYYICWLSWHRKVFINTVWLLTTYCWFIREWQFLSFNRQNNVFQFSETTGYKAEWIFSLARGLWCPKQTVKKRWGQRERWRNVIVQAVFGQTNLL